MKFGELRSDAEFLTEQAAQMHEDLEGIGAYALRRLNPSAHTSTEDLVETAERMRKQMQKSEHLVGMLEKHQTDISDLRSETEHEITKLESDRLKLTSPDEIKHIDEQLSKLQERKEKLEWMQQSASEMTEQFQDRVNRTGEILQEVDGERFNRISAIQRRRDIAKGVLTAPAKVTVSTVKSTAKDAFRRVNPLDRKINNRDTADHGVESLRLAYRTGRKTVHTVKTAKSTVATIRKTPRVIVNTAKSTVKVVATTVRIAANVLTHAVAALINPVTWIILFACAVIYVILSIIVIIMGGASVQTGTQAVSYTQQIGIEDADLDDAREFYRLACERNKGHFGALIDGLYFREDDRRRSDLVYMERSVAGAITSYTRGFPTDTYKSRLKSAWTISVPEAEAIAIAFVYLQMQENSTHGTRQQIYQIEYTQDVFNEIVDNAVMWSDSTYANQTCTANNCSEHHDSRPNPAYQTALNEYTNCVSRRDDFNAMVVPRATAYRNLLSQYNNAPPAAQSAMQDALDTAWGSLVEAFRNWESVFGYTGWEIDADIGINGSAWLQMFVDTASATLRDTDEYITSTYYICDHLHTLHSIGLYAYNKDTVMTALGFTDADKTWERMIEMGMIAPDEEGI